MNQPDPFEKMLKAHPIRKLPSEWRNEILGTALASVPTRPKPAQADWAGWWNSLAASLWPSPKAWAAISAIWVVTIALNTASEVENPGLSVVPTAQSVFNFQQVRLQRELMFVELGIAPEKHSQGSFPPSSQLGSRTTAI